VSHAEHLRYDVRLGRVALIRARSPSFLRRSFLERLRYHRKQQGVARCRNDRVSPSESIRARCILAINRDSSDRDALLAIKLATRFRFREIPRKFFLGSALVSPSLPPSFSLCLSLSLSSSNDEY